MILGGALAVAAGAAIWRKTRACGLSGGDGDRGAAVRGLTLLVLHYLVLHFDML